MCRLANEILHSWMIQKNVIKWNYIIGRSFIRRRHATVSSFNSCEVIYGTLPEQPRSHPFIELCSWLIIARVGPRTRVNVAQTGFPFAPDRGPVSCIFSSFSAFGCQGQSSRFRFRFQCVLGESYDDHKQDEIAESQRINFNDQKIWREI